MKHSHRVHLFSSLLINVSLCRNPLRLIYLIRFVLFPQSKPHGTLLPPVIKGSKSGAGPVQCLLREPGSCKLFEALVSCSVYLRSHGDRTTIFPNVWNVALGCFGYVQQFFFLAASTPELAVTSPGEEPGAETSDEPRSEREGENERRRREEMKREGYNQGVWRYWDGGGRRKLGSITSFLERSQEGKDARQRIDCTSLSLSLSLSLVLDEGQASCV